MKLTESHLSNIQVLMKECNVSEIEVFELRGRVCFVLTFEKQGSLIDQVSFDNKLEKIVGEKIVTYTKDSLKNEVELFSLSKTEYGDIIKSLTPLKQYVEEANTVSTANHTPMGFKP